MAQRVQAQDALCASSLAMRVCCSQNKKVWSAWNFIGEWQGPNATGSVSSAQVLLLAPLK